MGVSRGTTRPQACFRGSQERFTGVLAGFRGMIKVISRGSHFRGSQGRFRGSHGISVLPGSLRSVPGGFRVVLGDIRGVSCRTF